MRAGSLSCGIAVLQETLGDSRSYDLKFYELYATYGTWRCKFLEMFMGRG